MEGCATYHINDWGDYDNDGDLDVLVCEGLFGENINIYRNENASVNTIPNNPTGLTLTQTGNNMIFSWNRATDSETPDHALSYNLFIGTSQTISDMYSVQADISTGLRNFPYRGLVQDTFAIINPILFFSIIFVMLNGAKPKSLKYIILIILIGSFYQSPYVFRNGHFFLYTLIATLIHLDSIKKMNVKIPRNKMPRL
jgi:hypothetical protein